MYAAYDALSEDMKNTLESMVALHDMGDFRNNFTVGQSTGEKLTDAMQRFGCAIHQVVKTHPVSGRKYLYVNEGFTVHIIGKTLAVLPIMWTVKPSFTYRYFLPLTGCVLTTW